MVAAETSKSTWPGQIFDSVCEEKADLEMKLTARDAFV